MSPIETPYTGSFVSSVRRNVTTLAACESTGILGGPTVPSGIVPPTPKTVQPLGSASTTLQQRPRANVVDTLTQKSGIVSGGSELAGARSEVTFDSESRTVRRLGCVLKNRDQ